MVLNFKQDPNFVTNVELHSTLILKVSVLFPCWHCQSVLDKRTYTHTHHIHTVQDSADLDSILDEQFGRLYHKEKDVAHRLRQSKRTYKYLAQYLSHRADIERKYAKSIEECIKNKSIQLNESELINRTWNDMIDKESQIATKHEFYHNQLKEQSELMRRHYETTKTEQYDMKKQIRENESKADKTQKSMTKVE